MVTPVRRHWRSTPIDLTHKTALNVRRDRRVQLSVVKQVYIVT